MLWKLFKNNTGDNKYDCITVCRDCADICLLTASLIARNSKYAKDLMVVCARVCKDCAEACRKSCEGENSCGPECMSCAVACSECADLCNQS